MAKIPRPPPTETRAAASPLLALVQFLLRMVGAGAMGLANVLLHLIVLIVFTGLLLNAWEAMGTVHYSDDPAGAAAAAEQRFRIAIQTPDGPRIARYRDWLAQADALRQAPIELPMPSAAQSSALKPSGDNCVLRRHADGSHELWLDTPLQKSRYRYRVTAGVPTPISWRQNTAGMAVGSFAVSLLLLALLRKWVGRVWPKSRLLK